MSGGNKRVQLLVCELRGARPRIDRFDEEDLAFEDIAHASHDTLVGERFSYFGFTSTPQSCEGFIGREGVGDEVWPEARESGVQLDRAIVHQLGDGSAEAHDHVVWDGQSDPGSKGR